MLNHGVTFNIGPAKVCLPTIFETYLSDHKIYKVLELIVTCTFT